MASWYGGTSEEQRRLRGTFCSKMDECAPKWRLAFENGEAFPEVAGDEFDIVDG
jgi:hypothetical protein